jgi:hypothetical protein
MSFPLAAVLTDFKDIRARAQAQHFHIANVQASKSAVLMQEQNA